MPAVAGRRRRRATLDAGYVPLQGSVPPATRQKARAAADAAGISVGLYLEWLVERDEVDATGLPTWLPPKAEDQPALLPEDDLISRRSA